jgi:hypothetical protein
MENLTTFGDLLFDCKTKLATLPLIKLKRLKKSEKEAFSLPDNLK